MKNNLKPHPAELGAGIGLMFVSLVVMLIDTEMLPYMLMNISLGLMIASGLFSNDNKRKPCAKKPRIQNLDN